MASILTLWAVFIVGPKTMFPVHHYQPVVWSTEEKCKAEIERLLATKQIVIGDPEYHLKCIAVPDLSGEPA